MKKAMLIETLEAMQANMYGIADMYREEGNEDRRKIYMAKAAEVTTFIQMLKDNKFAMEIRSCYIKDDAKAC